MSLTEAVINALFFYLRAEWKIDVKKRVKLDFTGDF